VRSPRKNERIRIPPPLIRHRIPSGRGATEQPNVTGDGEAALTPLFWSAVVVTGAVAGLFGAALMALLFNLQFLAFGYHSGSLDAAVARDSDLRRLVALLVAGAIGGPAWYVLRRVMAGERSDIDDAVWNGNGRLSFRRSLGTSLISEFVIGLGASIGREAAPKLMGGASASVISQWMGLTAAQRRLLVACGGGAGFAAVYNVPLGGALFAAEILCGSLTLPIVLPALACSAVASATAWIYLPEHATYLDIPAYHVSARLLVWALIFGPLIGVASVGYVRLIAWVSYYSVVGKRALVAPLGAFAVLGVIGFRYPQLFGNGKDMAHEAFVGAGTFGLFIVLALLKPVVTALCLGSGAAGGLFTPVLSTGAVLGAALGLAWSQLWPGSPVGAFALLGAAAMIGASMQAPLAALALVLELTHSGFGLMVPMAVAVVTATTVARWIDGYSIYSARLSARPGSEPGA
jgi:H+/Cl- antiporter ClcA